jgi:ribulose 1,5-bisphosphate synthetase/thiazole synthase
MTLAGNHQGKDWKVHYDQFITELDQIKEYDIALVAAGGYGMLIADYIYTQKKQVLYIGGALQIFFGIIGKRWFENKEILAMMNDYWVRPKERPDNCLRVERGCYW